MRFMSARLLGGSVVRAIIGFQSSNHDHTPEAPGSGLEDSHAAAVKHTVIRVENTIGMIKRYVQLTTVMAPKQSASAHTVVRMTARVSAGRLPSCQANTAANR